MILAAGRGQRMSPITDTIPKPLVPVFNKPLIVHQIDHLARSGFTEIIINLSYLGENIAQALGDGANFGVNIRYSKEPFPALDVAGGVAKALPLLGESPFLLTSCDIYTDFNYEMLKVIDPKVAHLIMVDNPKYHLEGDFKLHNNILEPKSKNSKENFTYANIGVFQPNLFKNLPSARYALASLLKPSVNARLITGELYQGLWANVGTVDDIAQLELINTKVKTN